MYDIGKIIKKLRIKNGMTQEVLAQKLCISCQAISKWENGASLPDVLILPELSVIFGVTIDEIFEITDDSHMERIQNMLCNNRILSEEDFHYANQYLLDKINSGVRNPKYFTLLADLYNHISDGYKIVAEKYAKEALEIEPENKDNHCALRRAKNGVISDWNVSNHHELIDYYKNFVKLNPTYSKGYLWLLDNLLADGRVSEAEEVLEQLRQLENNYLINLYQGEIYKVKGCLQEAYKEWKKMPRQYPTEWLAYFSFADCMAKACRYDEAVLYFNKATEIQPKPRYTDAFEAIAHIEEICGNYNAAIEARKNEIQLLNEEWNITLGEMVDFPKREIERLKGCK
jgi:tetratricopeptide (TPR) repeat protein